ncbi:glycosyltransferase family 2 protein [Acidocella facilis]|uniref:glycosyltransferase family 2 protein n=1 Tax=Acidocella facilis TaxID=525 RepID=UPI001F2F3297|nr:glycosyltransferase family 2 protein [Acidocella facilis]
MPELSIVMPCLNEAQTLPLCIAKARAFLASHGIEGEIVIGDNGSSDGSQELARALGARVVDVQRRGYGAALHGAVSAARGRYCIMGDSDDSYDFSKLAPFLQALRRGADLVMGNRFAGGISPGAMPWKNRYLGNPVLSGLGRFLFRTPIKDFHCGLRGFSRDAFLRMDLRTTGMEFASEMVIKAALLGMRIEEVPTTLDKDGRARPPHLRPWRDGWRHLRFMLLFSPAWLFLYPGLGLALLGLGLGGALMTGPLRIAGVRLDLGALLYCVTMVELGAQAVIFAWLARAYTIQEGLLPASLRMRRLEPLVTLENGLLLGLGLLLLGLGLLGWAIAIWSQAGFGNLDVGRIARIIMGSSLALSLGMEVLLSSFLLSTLRLHIREN